MKNSEVILKIEYVVWGGHDNHSFGFGFLSKCWANFVNDKGGGIAI